MMMVTGEMKEVANDEVEIMSVFSFL